MTETPELELYALRKFVDDYDELRKKVEACRILGKKIVLTSGTFDLTHIGHWRYLLKAKASTGTRPEDTILVVGIDSDKQVKERKGPNRPITPENERVECVCHSQYTDIVTISHEKGPQLKLMEVVMPDVLIVTKRVGATEEQKDGFKKYCGEVVELESQATTSTSANIRKIMVDLVETVEEEMDKMLKSVNEAYENFTSRIKDLKEK